MRTAEDFRNALEDAGGGAVITYHIGQALRGALVIGIAKEALRAYYRGEVELAQKRVHGSHFAYLAIVRREVKKPLVPLRDQRLVENLFSRGGYADADLVEAFNILRTLIDEIEHDGNESLMLSPLRRVRDLLLPAAVRAPRRKRTARPKPVSQKVSNQ